MQEKALKEELRKKKDMRYTESKGANVHPTTSMILNVNGLNNSIARQRFLDWIKKIKPRSNYTLS